MVLEALGNPGEEKHGQNRRVLPVEEADNFAVGARRPRYEDVVRLEVWMADVETIQGGVTRSEPRCDAKVPL